MQHDAELPALLERHKDTVTSLWKDTQCRDVLDIRTMQLGTNHCIVTAVVPPSKENTMSGQVF